MAEHIVLRRSQHDELASAAPIQRPKLPGPWPAPACAGSEAMPLTGLPLGMIEDAEYETRTVRLAPGDRVFLYTDGVTEANSAAGEEYGDPMLAEALARLGAVGAPDLVRGIVRSVD